MGLKSAQMCFVHPAQGCKSPSMGVLEIGHWVSSLTQTLSFPFTVVIYPALVCTTLGPWTRGLLRSLLTLNISDPESVFSLLILDSSRDFWWEKRILWTAFVPFWQKYHPSNQRGVRNYKSLVIWTQRGQSLTKDSLNLLSLTHRKPPGKIKGASSFRLRKKGPLIAKTPPFRGDPCITHAESMWGWNTMFSGMAASQWIQSEAWCWEEQCWPHILALNETMTMHASGNFTQYEITPAVLGFLHTACYL